LSLTAHLAAMVKKRKNVKVPVFDAQAFLDSAGMARIVVEYRRSQEVYSQGHPANSVMYVQKGSVKLSVVNEAGKEAVVAILGPGDFLGEGGAGRPICSYGGGDRDHTHDLTRYREKRDDSRAPR
jgi:CRP-like cAMP-binding protein